MKCIFIVFVVFSFTACSQNDHTNQMDTFPTIKAQTLARQNIVFPDVLKGKYGFIAVAFKQDAQSQIDTWYTLYIDTLQAKDVVFYEIPMISGGWKMMSSWIDGGMRSGIPVAKHPYVATYYGPLQVHQGQLGVTDDQLAYVYLIDPNGKIIFRGNHFAKPGDAALVTAALNASRK
jgi:hypothetical protein